MKLILSLFIILGSTVLMSSACARTFDSNQHSPIGQTVDQSEKISEQTNPQLPTVQIQIADQTITAEVASTQKQKERGLSYRKSLEPNSGMLFDFSNQPKFIPSFWMKGMNFDLDLIWIEDQTIIDISHQVTAPSSNQIPNNQLPTYSPSKAVNFVLEVPSGWAQQHNIDVGQTIEIKN
ncbi:MAG: DUF192 domain-containing protein [Candidatus Doudnabacteria bacterium]